MNQHDSKTVARNFYESYNNKALDRSFDDFIAVGLVNHTMGGGLGRNEWLEFDKALLTACPDLRLTVKEQLAEGNRVVTHWAFEGTHTDEFMDMSASGNIIRLAGISIDRVEAGKITEHCAIADFTGLMQQFMVKGSLAV
jgi:predicted ester cyclase